MTTLASILRRLRGSVRTSAFEAQMDAELAHHIELETEAAVARGLSPAEARAEARRRFGSLAEIKDDCRDSWGVRALDALGQDVRFGVRGLLRHRGYTAVVLLTLGLGIGANTAVFSVVHAVLLAPLPYAGGDRLIEIRQQAPGSGIDDLSLSAKEVADYRAQAETLDAVVEYHQMSFNLLGKGEASRVQTGVVSANFFDALGVAPAARPDVRRARRREGRAAGAGAELRLLEERARRRPARHRTHVRDERQGPHRRRRPAAGAAVSAGQRRVHAGLGVPVPFGAVDGRATGSMRMVSAIGRMRPGVSLERATSDLGVIAKRMAAAYPNDYKGAVEAGLHGEGAVDQGRADAPRAADARRAAGDDALRAAARRRQRREPDAGADDRPRTRAVAPDRARRRARAASCGSC